MRNEAEQHQMPIYFYVCDYTRAQLCSVVDRVAAATDSSLSGARATDFGFMTSPACVSDWLRAAYADVLRDKPTDPMASLAQRCRQKATSVALLGSSGAAASPSTTRNPAASSSTSGRDPQMSACRSVRELGVPHFLW